MSPQIADEIGTPCEGSFLLGGSNSPQSLATLCTNSDSDGEEYHDMTDDGRGSLSQTVANVMKVCLGTGILALPYAFAKGGFVFSPLAMFAVAYWNVYGVSRLCDCLALVKYLDRAEGALPAPAGSSANAVVAYRAIGARGVLAVDAIMLIFLVGVTSAWVIASSQLIGETPLSLGSPVRDALLVFALVLPVLTARDLSGLSKISAGGLIAVLLSFAIILLSGLNTYGLEGLRRLSWDDALPNSVADLCCYYGIAVFAFGIVPVAYNLRASMARPNLFPRAASVGVFACSFLYVLVGEACWVAYAPAPGGIRGDVIDMLPNDAVGTTVRLALAAMLVVSIPLMLVPAEELVYRKLRPQSEALPAKIALRVGLLGACLGLAMTIPNFALVLGLVGCACTGVISFVLPALYHLRLLQRVVRAEDRKAGLDLAGKGEEEEVRRRRMYQLHVDYVMLVLGVASTIFSTYQTVAAAVAERRVSESS
uniref:Amino acid transporter transmembrane domain-containing protein n=3 Tax=Corethron hystrix TaxID=216773 RepID=A0A7S1B5E3_9STRA|mmetsp:Transcript_12855/g.28378  ORF Transcript_12855/g.28378 Transcript_12855/m.28378 type:complete len:481 (+) Transcript_12855:129-1571(+)